MHFTREPIIETIISPKDGFKLLVRNSKGGNAEEFYVDAVEVVSFGKAFFFRSLERPKTFMVPASDYEVLEVKETKVVLKNVSHERNIKIGGGREAPMRSPREPAPERAPEDAAPVEQEVGAAEVSTEGRMDKQRRDRRHRRRRRSGDDHERRPHDPQEHKREEASVEEQKEGGASEDETRVSSSMFTSLIPPPSTLISQTLHRYKDLKEPPQESPPSEEAVGEKEHKEPPKEEPKEKKEEPKDGGESSPLNRVVAEVENGSLSSTYYSSLGNDPYFF